MLECEEACAVLHVKKLREITNEKEVQKIKNEIVRKRGKLFVCFWILKNLIISKKI